MMRMKIEDAIVYVLVNVQRGLSTQEIADLINHYRLHIRKDGKPVTSSQVYAVICRHREVFVKEGGIIHLIM